MNRTVETLMHAIAAAAQERRPLPEALQDLDFPAAHRVAERLESGDDLRTALGNLLPEGLGDLLAGPRPDTAEAALLVAEWLRLRREDQLAAIERLTHPLCGLLAVVAGIITVTAIGPAPAAGWLAAGAVVLVGAILLIAASTPAWGERLPSLGALALHARLAGSYERAALVARWRLPEERLLPLLGGDLVRLAPVLGDPGAEPHCRRLAAYHRTAAGRARRRLWWLVMALGYIAGGCLLMASAAPVLDDWITTMTAFSPW